MVRVVLIACALLVAATAGWLVKIYLVAQREQLAAAAANQKPQRLTTAEILVVKSDVDITGIVTARELVWQPWPEDGVNARYITRRARPDAIEQLAGSAARQALFAGEPVTDEKLVMKRDGGFLAAVLPEGRRAVAIKVDEASGIAGLVLPGDRVDVILTHEVPSRESDSSPGGAKRFVSETVVEDLRVLAVDQDLKHDGNKASMLGKTVTLEVNTPQAEAMSLGRVMGALSLSLRSSFGGKLADNRERPFTGSTDLSRALRDSERPRAPVAVAAMAAAPYTVTVFHGLAAQTVALAP